VMQDSRIRTNGTNWDGGGLYLADSDLLLTGCTLDQNVAWGYGGGLNQFGGTARLVDNNVNSNHSIGNYGGGLSFANTIVEIDSNLIAANRSFNVGGGLAILAGQVTIRDTVFGDNLADDVGGALYLWETTAQVEDSTFIANQARYGGAVSMSNGDATFDRSIIVANTADYGGALRAYTGRITMTNNVIADNQATTEGSGLYLTGASARLVHTTVARNSDGDGCGLLLTKTDGTPASRALLTNTILAGHTVGVCVDADNRAELEATLWGSGGWANQADWAGAGTVLTGTHNVWGSPDFAGPDVRDYHIGPASAAINAGVDAGVADDLDGQARPMACLPDLGADELAAVSPPAGLRVTQAVTGTGLLTATLAWNPPPGAVTTTLRSAPQRIDEDNWAQAAIVADSLPGSAQTHVAVVAYDGGPVYFASRSYACGVESPVSHNALWPKWDLFLPLLVKEG